MAAFRNGWATFASFFVLRSRMDLRSTSGITIVVGISETIFHSCLQSLEIEKQQRQIIIWIS